MFFLLRRDRTASTFYFRPKVLHNKATGMFVLWVDFLPNASSPLAAFPEAKLLVARSATLEGPFEFFRFASHLRYSGPGDFTLMEVARNNKAYVAYGAWSNSHSISIEELNENYTDSVNVSSGIISPPVNEAPVLFERKGWYYLFFGECCCFCKSGAGTHVFTSSTPLGPWVPLPSASKLSQPANLNALLDPENRTTRTIPSQNNYVFVVPGRQPDDDQYIWMGESALDGIFGHDLQSWHILQFNDSYAPPLIGDLTWEDWFIISMN